MFIFNLWVKDVEIFKVPLQQFLHIHSLIHNFETKRMIM